MVLGVKVRWRVGVNLGDFSNESGQTAVRIKFPKNITTSSCLKSHHLNLYFGPPQIFTLRKISGYELIQDNSDSTEFKKHKILLLFDLSTIKIKLLFY